MKYRMSYFQLSLDDFGAYMFCQMYHFCGCSKQCSFLLFCPTSRIYKVALPKIIICNIFDKSELCGVIRVVVGRSMPAFSRRSCAGLGIGKFLSPVCSVDSGISRSKSLAGDKVLAVGSSGIKSSKFLLLQGAYLFKSPCVALQFSCLLFRKGSMKFSHY